jgi:hypothetical protein
VCTRVQRLLGTIRFQLQQLEDAVTAGGGGGGGSGGGGADEEARAALTQTLNAAFQELAALDRAIAEHGGVKADYYRKCVARGRALGARPQAPTTPRRRAQATRSRPVPTRAHQHATPRRIRGALLHDSCAAARRTCTLACALACVCFAPRAERPR